MAFVMAAGATVALILPFLVGLGLLRMAWQLPVCRGIGSAFRLH